jgi:hypothetical protein
LCQELPARLHLLYDHADFHKKIDFDAVVHQDDHHILFLLPCSRDDSRIEPGFANILKAPPRHRHGHRISHRDTEFPHIPKKSDGIVWYWSSLQAKSGVFG